MLRCERKNRKNWLLYGLLAMLAVSLCFSPEAALGADGQQERTVVRVGYYLDSEDFQGGAAEGERKTGYAYEFYQEVAKYAGWSYEYVYGDYADIYEMLLNGEVDIMAGITKVPGREEQMLFPDYAMGGEVYYIFAPSSRQDLTGYDMSPLDGARIGVKSNSYMSTMLADYAEKNGFSCEAVGYDTLADRLEAYGKGEIDFILTVETDRMEGFKPVYNLGSLDFYFVVAKDRPDLLEELNAAQEKILESSPRYISGLEEKYFDDSEEEATFTEEERAWFSEHPKLWVGYLEDYMPFCGTGDDGALTGALADILPTLSEALGVTFEPVAYGDYAQLVEALDAGEIDILFPSLEDMWYSDMKNHSQTDAVGRSRLCLIYAGSYDDLKLERVAVFDGSPLEPFYLESKYPDAVRVDCGSWEGCFGAVKSGTADFTLLNSDLYYRFLSGNPEYSDLKVADLDDVVSLCFCVRRTEPVLYLGFNKAVGNLKLSQFNDAVVRNSGVERKYTVKDFVTEHFGLVWGLVIFFFAVLVLFFAVYLHRVRYDRAELRRAYDKELKYIESQEKDREAIREACEMAERANEAKSDFLARMSHDLRTPLNAIMGMAAIAETYPDDRERVLDCLGKINASGGHLLKLVNEVLDLSKIEAGQMNIEEDRFNLQELIDDTLLLVHPQANEKAQDIRVSYRQVEHMDVVGDSPHIQRIFVNILENAVKYTPTRGTIRLTVTERPVEKPTVGCYEFVFADNGIGMSPEFLEHIFEPFTKETEDGSAAGTGLGLSIANNIARMLGGSIRVESEQGKGSRFTVTLFLRIQDSRVEQQRQSEESGTAGLLERNYAGKRILLVEDNELNAEITTELLRMAGIEVSHAWNGKEAYDALTKAPPGTFDIVFMDIQMPVMNGYEATRAIREAGREDLRGIPIIAVSANAFDEDVRAALESGMNEHIAKPLDPRKLADVLHKYFPEVGEKEQIP